MGTLQAPSKSPLQAFIASGLQARGPGKRFWAQPCNVYYMDMPGMGIPGSSIIATGNDEYLRWYATGSTSNWHTRDIYCFFHEPVPRDKWRMNIMIGWNGLYLYSHESVTTKAVTGEVGFALLLEAYDGAFAYNNLPDMYVDPDPGLAWGPGIHREQKDTDTRDLPGVDGTMLIRGSTGMASGTSVHGVRLSLWRQPAWGLGTTVIDMRLGSFLTGAADIDVWKWPEGVWAFTWDV